MTMSINIAPSVTTNAPASNAEQLPDVIGDSDDVARHQAAAALIPITDVVPCTVNPNLAVRNAMTGRAALLAVRADLEATGLRFDWDRLASLETLCRALTYTATRVAAYPRVGEIKALLRETMPLRKMLLTSARLHSLSGRCPAAEVARIAKGRGSYDAAVDLSDLADLHTRHDLVDAKGPATSEQVARALALGQELRSRLIPNGVRRPGTRTETQRQTAIQRDRFWTLLTRYYADVERAAGALWGSRYRQHVPALGSRPMPRRRPPKLVAPTG